MEESMIRVIIIFLVLFFGSTHTAASADSQTVRVSELNDFKSDAALMSNKRLPMVVEMAADDCPYCVQVEEYVLRPMIMSGEYSDKILLRKVYIDESTTLLDIDGDAVSQADFADRYGVNLTPTILFLDEKGREIAPRMVGVPLIDFYGIYLDQHIETARTALQE